MRSLVLSGIVLALAGAVQAETVFIRADEWFPHNGIPGSSEQGYMIDIAEASLAAAGYELDYQIMPWTRALDSVRSGKFDCVVGAYKEDAEDFVFPDEEFGMDEVFFYVKKGGVWRYNGVESLEGVRLGVIADYSYGDPLDEYVKTNVTTGAVQVAHGNNALEQNIKKLVNGRIDAYLESRAVSLARLQAVGSNGEVEEAGSLGKRSPMYVACSPAKPGSKAIVKVLTDGIRKLRSEGRLDAILAKYGIKDWK